MIRDVRQRYSDAVLGLAPRRMLRRHSLAGYGQTEGEWAGGIIAAADDAGHSPIHAAVVGVATGVAVHVIVKLIDKWFKL